MKKNASLHLSAKLDVTKLNVRIRGHIVGDATIESFMPPKFFLKIGRFEHNPP